MTAPTTAVILGAEGRAVREPGKSNKAPREVVKSGRNGPRGPELGAGLLPTAAS